MSDVARHARRLEELKAFTRRTWEAGHSKDFLERSLLYVDQLLPREMEWLAQEPARCPRLVAFPGGRCDTLVLLVGLSIEPLLQTVCAYRPSEVVLVLNQSYGTLTAAIVRDVIERCIAGLCERRLLDSSPDLRRCPPLAGDTPSAVFRFLLEEFRDRARSGATVIDVTGGKKSMVAGAFVFAAFSSTAISYVDFEDYAEEFRRPYGCTARIGLIDNPIAAFGLRDWARVRALYEQTAFDGAARLLETVSAAMTDGGVFSASEVTAARTLGALLATYAAWDDGDYQEAARLGATLPEPARQVLPSAITHLAPIWPLVESVGEGGAIAERLLVRHGGLERGAVEDETTFYARLPELSVYAQDELARIERLIRLKEDGRSAFLRADGLVEVLLTARLFVLWKTGQLTIECDIGDVPLGSLEAERRRALYAAYFESTANPSEIVQALRWSPGTPRGKRILRLGRDPRVNPDPRPGVRANRIELEKFWVGTALGSVERLRRVRNKIVHTWLPISRPLAEAALEIARACWDDFAHHWAVRLDPAFVAHRGPYEAVPWNGACAACGIDYLVGEDGDRT